MKSVRKEINHFLAFDPSFQSSSPPFIEIVDWTPVRTLAREMPSIFEYRHNTQDNLKMQDYRHKVEEDLLQMDEEDQVPEFGRA